MDDVLAWRGGGGGVGLSLLPVLCMARRFCAGDFGGNPAGAPFVGASPPSSLFLHLSSQEASLLLLLLATTNSLSTKGADMVSKDRARREMARLWLERYLVVVVLDGENTGLVAVSVTGREEEERGAAVSCKKA